MNHKTNPDSFCFKVTIRIRDRILQERIKRCIAASGLTMNDEMTNILVNGLDGEKKRLGLGEFVLPEFDPDFVSAFLPILKEMGADLRDSLAIISSVYHMLLAYANGERLSERQVESGMFDGVPERFRRKGGKGGLN